MRAPSLAPVFEAARKHAADANAIQQINAQFVLRDVESLLLADCDVRAAKRALKSLGYSVGVFAPVYAECAKMIEAREIWDAHVEEYRTGLDSEY